MYFVYVRNVYYFWKESFNVLLINKEVLSYIEYAAHAINKKRDIEERNALKQRSEPR